jgi:hypothetical protein
MSEHIERRRRQRKCCEISVICRHLLEALCRTRTDDPFLTMEVLYQLS